MGDQCNDSDQEQVHAVPSRRDALIAGAALVAAPFLGRVTSIVQAAQGRQSRACAGGEGSGHGDGMVELCWRQGQFEIFASHADKGGQFHSPEDRVDMALR